MTDYQAKKQAYLEHVAPNYRGMVANAFLAPVRSQGLKEPRYICRQVYQNYREAIGKYETDIYKYETEWVDRYQGKDWMEGYVERARENIDKLLGYLNLMRQEREKALGMAEWAVWWESLDDREKKRQKVERAKPHQQEYMASLQPTGKQLALLDSFGYQGTVDNRLHASQLIDEYINLRQDYKHRGKQ